MADRAWVHENDCRRIDIIRLQVQIDDLKNAVVMLRQEIERLTGKRELQEPLVEPV